MPIYEYHCPHCGSTFEEWLKTAGNSSADAAMCPCPSCGTASPRILSNTSFLLKGGGWFVNHEAPQSSAAPDAAGDTANASAESSANTSADVSDTKSGGQAGTPENASAASPATPDSRAGAN